MKRRFLSVLPSENKTLIKGLNDSLFSQNFRFPEFKEKWQTYKISDFLTFFSTNSLAWEQLEYSAVGFYNLHYGLIHQGLPLHIDLTDYIFPVVKAKSIPTNYEMCQDGDVAFADASEDTDDVGKVVEFVNCNKQKIVCGLHTIHGRDKLDITIRGFKGFAFSSKLFRNQIKKLAQGTKVYSISLKTLNVCLLDVPSKDEQLKIVNLLTGVNRKIVTEKKLLYLYKSQKEYFLKKIFI